MDRETMDGIGEEAGATDGVERLLSEDMVPLSALARELDRDAATLGRWCLRGTLAPAAGGARDRVKLEHFRLGGVIYTTRQAFRRYVRAMTVGGVGAAPADTHRTAAQRRSDSEAAAREASRLGC